MSCKRATFIRHISRNNHLGQNYFNKYVNDNFQRRKKFDFNLGDHRNYHSSREPRSTIVKLTPQEVDNILRANEYTHDFSEGSVKSYDSNQLASNNPIEDTRSEASCLLTSGFLVGVFDGHGGGSCAQVVAKRLYPYITACLLPQDQLLNYISSHKSASDSIKLFKAYNNKVQLVDDVRDIYRKSFKRFLDNLVKGDYREGFDMDTALVKAFMSLDDDLSREGLPDKDGKFNRKTLSVAMSGCVSCVAHIDGPHLHIANVGDCSAVLGSLSETNTWTAKKLTDEHNIENHAEVQRILSEHPPSEKNTVIRIGRLLGQLAPLRAMGDFRFKWSKQIMSQYVAKHFGPNVIPQNYFTPPYLTARPDIVHHRLTPRDKFLIIATDGLWDMVSPLQTVRLVGEHMKGKVTLSPLKLPQKNMKLGEINEILLQRKEGMKTKPRDSNAATHLIRNALGGTDYGIDHNKLSQLLSLPDDVVRVFRDDITITVVYFDSEFLRHCPV
ncbi:pyruvate dehydrogenase [acetyl-transferring]-phosphatase 1, mitochondrial isoform X1 [Harmonia axyridis]|uniref:pyruvate dehydrogenase [acetyl-transferring]-phosphatase 1, mitochondrial isoform X1 n=1 Tax=Harmonia axyridis TaxID=115357 RepID=UPI001E2786E3|nr:pyruvate dehydrogenase [acetyl-transferring]-phosphatase 1, mitochondrial isoform X1 [Harmonia axyridis]